jgi:hypothetical protein
MRSRVLVILLSALTAACLGHSRRAASASPSLPGSLTLVGQFSIPPLGRYPPDAGLPFGGISAIARSPRDGEVFGVTDATDEVRVYRFRLAGTGASFQVTIGGFVSLQVPEADADSDHEGLVVLPNGHFLVSSEGTGEPRQPPGISEFGPLGNFVRKLRVPDKFIPERTGTLTRGAGRNSGFESLTLTPDGKQLLTATETPLFQDGGWSAFYGAARTRILEYVARDGTFHPRREFAYVLDPLDKPGFEAGQVVNGLVDLLALDGRTLLALERSYIEDVGRNGRSYSRIRVYRISLQAATDISGIDSLTGRPEVTPVAKSLVLDLSATSGLNPDLVGRLENFEGIGFGPTLPDGRASIILVSDDNFNATQRTWFLLFAAPCHLLAPACSYSG